MSEVTVEQLERQLSDNKRQAEFGEAVKRLVNNPDYRLVVEKGFLLEECARYAQQSANPALDERQRADALLIAQSAGAFKRFLAVSIQLGNQCADDVINIQHALEDARAEPEEE